MNKIPWDGNTFIAGGVRYKIFHNYKEGVFTLIYHSFITNKDWSKNFSSEKKAEAEIRKDMDYTRGVDVGGWY